MQLNPTIGLSANGSKLLPVSPKALSAIFKNTALSKKLLLLCSAFFLFNVASAQYTLKITKVKEIHYNKITETWEKWPPEFIIYEKGREPLLTIYKLDDTGIKFKVQLRVGDEDYIFNVAYTGFDEVQNYAKYKDENGDEIFTAGATLSRLSKYGWPDNATQIYFLVKSHKNKVEYEFR